MVAGAGVLGNDRRPDESCAPEPTHPDPGPAMRWVHNAAEVEPAGVEVPEQAERIVVLAGDQLDTLCALGLQSRVVGAALPDGTASQPSYLGAVLHGVEAVGSRSTPDRDAIAALHPDLILGAQGLTPGYAELAEIAPTVFRSFLSGSMIRSATSLNSGAPSTPSKTRCQPRSVPRASRVICLVQFRVWR